MEKPFFLADLSVKFDFFVHFLILATLADLAISAFLAIIKGLY